MPVNCHKHGVNFTEECPFCQLDGTDPVNHPKHYTSGGAKCECGKVIECIQITEGQNFCIGNAMKYLWRADHKGKPIEDLEKAAWYIQREIAKRKGGI